MFIKRMRLENYEGFHGINELKLKRGFNVITGTCGSGRSSLARAVRFGLFGLVGYDDVDFNGSRRSNPINSNHLSKCEETSETAYCSVELDLEHRNKAYNIESRISLSAQGVMRTELNVPRDIYEIIKPVFFRHIHIVPARNRYWDGGFKEDKSLPRWIRNIAETYKHLAKNLEAGIRMVFLDDCFSVLDDFGRRRLLEHLEDIPLEQVIILEREYTSLDLETDIKLRYDPEVGFSRITQVREES